VKARFSYSVGETVRIKVGPFQNFTGRIEEVDEQNATLKVRVKIFTRTQPIELRFLDVEKITFTEEQ
jgi:transcriptional antiterminator NusG